MELRRQIGLLDRAVSIERSAIRLSFRIATVVFVAGLVGAFLVNRLAPSDMGNAKLVLTVCTGFGSFLSGIPIKDVATKRLRIECLSFLKSEFEDLQAAPVPDEQQLAAIDKRLWTLVEKNI